MSGPKVVRIVTRDELIEICRAHLARLDAALSQWERIGRRNSCLDETALKGARTRRDELVNLLAKDRFMELQKQVPVEISLLQSDMETRLAAAAAEKAAANSRERRRGEAAGAILSALRNSGKTIEPSLERAIERVAAGGPDDGALAAGLRLLAPESSDRRGQTRAHAEKLKSGEASGPSLEDWLLSQGLQTRDDTQERLEAKLTTLAQLDPELDLSPWETRIREAVRETDLFRRRLLLDGLEVDLGRTTAEAKALLRARDALRLQIAEIATAGLPNVEEYAATLESAQVVAALDVATSRCIAAMEAHRATQAAAARRAAVLEGLAGLGYEVTDGMSTAWVDQGRVVLRKAAQPEYGVEVAGSGESGRLQLRAVALTNGNVGPDPSRDADIETMWCGDVARLSQYLGKEGGQLAIERALAVGSTPLKRIEAGEVDNSRAAREGPAPQARRLP